MADGAYNSLLPQAGEGPGMAAMTRRCEASGAGMAASHPLPQPAGFASNVSRDVRVFVNELLFRCAQSLTPIPSSACGRGEL